MRQPIIAGNWKMNMTVTEATMLVEALKPLVADAACEVVLCPPFTAISTVADLVEDTHIAVGAQNMYHAESGAYTGEISPEMLVDCGVKYVIVGHSERRELFKETNKCVNAKIKLALAHGLSPIMCVGETLKQRESGETIAHIHDQLEQGLSGISPEDMVSIVIAYEPIWAIGTGRTATPEQAGEVCESIRQKILDLYGEEVAESVRIQYGGSVKGSNAKEILGQPHIDGALVGGASLVADDFAAIVNAAK